MSNNAPQSLPTLEEFFLKSPIYMFYECQPNKTFEYLYNAVSFRETLDTHCVQCGKHSTFKGDDKNVSNNLLMNSRGATASISELGFSSTSLRNFEFGKTQKGGADYFLNKAWIVECYCTRVNSHKMFFVINATLDKFGKIGQYPSIADLELPSIKKYQKVLANDYSDFSKAIGLTSHGVGIGAFVYLRRIFENLIEEAHQLEITRENWNEDDYEKSRMSDKIILLKDKLPDFLSKNRSLYSILSKGIHELKEDECLRAFPLMKNSIELILDQKLAKKEALRKELEAQAALNILTKDLSNS